MTQYLTIKEKEERKFTFDSQGNVSLRVFNSGGSIPGFEIPHYDSITLTYSGSDVSTVIYKLSGDTVATLTLTYTDGNLTEVVKS